MLYETLRIMAFSRIIISNGRMSVNGLSNLVLVVYGLPGLRVARTGVNDTPVAAILCCLHFVAHHFAG